MKPTQVLVLSVIAFSLAMGFQNCQQMAPIDDISSPSTKKENDSYADAGNWPNGNGSGNGDLDFQFDETPYVPPISDNSTETPINTNVPLNPFETLMVHVYATAFDRVPDAEGLSYWQMEYNKGASVGAILHAITVHQGFQDRIAKLNDVEFLQLSYRLIQQREVDSGGLQYWLIELSKGYPRQTIINILLNSDEFKMLLQSKGLRPT